MPGWNCELRESKLLTTERLNVKMAIESKEGKTDSSIAAWRSVSFQVGQVGLGLKKML